MKNHEELLHWSPSYWLYDTPFWISVHLLWTRDRLSLFISKSHDLSDQQSSSSLCLLSVDKATQTFRHRMHHLLTGFLRTHALWPPEVTCLQPSLTDPYCPGSHVGSARDQQIEASLRWHRKLPMFIPRSVSIQVLRDVLLVWSNEPILMNHLTVILFL